jgi:hypothetical protein
MHHCAVDLRSCLYYSRAVSSNVAGINEQNVSQSWRLEQ